LLEEERRKVEMVIEQDKNLRDYYTCFCNVFKIVYITASTVIQQRFYHPQQLLSPEKYLIAVTLLGEAGEEWTQEKQEKLNLLSDNVYELSRTLQDF
jgi:hypothetical protein